MLDQMDESMERILKQEFTRFGLLVEEGARALAPHDRGDLTDTINADPAKIIAGGVEVEIGVGSIYGVYQHEKAITRWGSYPKYDNGAKFPDYYKNGYGARTRSKPSWRGHRPGRKYLERAVQTLRPDFDEMNRRALQRIMEGRL